MCCDLNCLSVLRGLLGNQDATALQEILQLCHADDFRVIINSKRILERCHLLNDDAEALDLPEAGKWNILWDVSRNKLPMDWQEVHLWFEWCKYEVMVDACSFQSDLHRQIWSLQLIPCLGWSHCNECFKFEIIDEWHCGWPSHLERVEYTTIPWRLSKKRSNYGRTWPWEVYSFRS